MAHALDARVRDRDRATRLFLAEVILDRTCDYPHDALNELFDTKRLIRKIGAVDERTFRELAKALTLTLFPFLLLK